MTQPPAPTQYYIELSTNLQLAEWLEYYGRKYADKWLAESQGTVKPNTDPPEAKEPWEGQPFARDWIVTQGKPHYPVPPDQHIPPPDQPPPEGFTYVYLPALTLPGAQGVASGGVIALNAGVFQFDDDPIVLSNGHEYSFDLEANKKTLEQLSPAAQLALNPPPPW